MFWKKAPPPPPVQEESAGKLDGKQFSVVRKRVMRRLLLGSGFVMNKSEYLSKRDGRLWYVAFGTKKFGGGFEIRVALHLDYLPRCTFTVWPGAPVPTAMSSELCAFNRLVRRQDKAQHYDYGKTEAEAEQILEEATGRALQVLGEMATLVGDGRPLFGLLPPEALAADTEWLWEMRSARSVQDLRTFSSRMRLVQVLPDWDTPLPAVAIILAYIARHHGATPLVKQYAEVARLATRPGLRTDTRLEPYMAELEAWYGAFAQGGSGTQG